MRNRTVIYARLSREDENKIYGNKESRSIENQISALTTYCIEKGLNLVEIYYDDGYSGATLNRPDMQRMLQDMKLHKFDIIIVKDVSRLGRSLHRVGELIDKIFPENNIRLISVNDRYDSQTYKGEESIIIRNFLNEYYLKEFRKKCKKSRDYRVRNKHIIGTPKYGYLYDKDNNEYIDEEAAKIIRMIFDLVGNKGYNLSQVAQILNKKKIPTRSYHQLYSCNRKKYQNHISKQWDRHAVNDIASDYEYCGHSLNLVGHKYKKSERILIRDTHLAIIDEELFRKTQNVIAENRKVGRNGTYEHIANLIKDSKTGFTFVYNPIRKDKKCKACYTFRGVSGSINADILHEVLLKDALNVIQCCNDKENRIYSVFKKKVIHTGNFDISNLKSRLDKVNERYSILLEKNFNNLISEYDFQIKSSELQEQIKEIEQQIASCNQANEKLKLFDIRFNRFLEDIKTLPEQKLDIIRLVIKKVLVNKIYSPNKFDITVCYKFEE